MTQIIGWFLILMTLICLGSPFVAWWKLRKIKNSLDQMQTKMEDRMPPVTFFGSYRKGLSWARKNQNELPEHLSASVKQALIFDRLAIIALGILFIVAAISMFFKS